MSFQLKTFNWFFSILLLLSVSAFAQQTTVDKYEERMKKSKAPLEEGKSNKENAFFERNIKFGWDVSNLLMGALGSDRSGLDFSVDFSIKKNLYGIIEVGNDIYKEYGDGMNYFSEGNYIKLGFDSDMRKDKKDLSRDIFYVGTRYAFASFNQQLRNIQSFTSYWPATTEQKMDFKNQAHWAEAVAGFKVEVLKNIYLGLGMRIKILLYQSGDDVVKPAPYIPGYGKNSGALIFGFNYNVYYNLPLNYSKKTPNRAH